MAENGDNSNSDRTMGRTGNGNEQNLSLNPGATLGQYKIVRLLGRGGMGEVYEVEHTTLEKHFTGKWFW